MKKDIKNRQDIQTLINCFYDEVKSDETIGYFFTDVVHVDWDAHLPKMYDFWENVLFNTGGYEGNPMQKHHEIHHKSALTKEHFNQWLLLFTNTVNKLFEGEKAELIKQRASSIAMVMQLKII
jgi:hemoglobin